MATAMATGEMSARCVIVVAAALALAGCSSAPAPSANTAQAQFVPSSNTIEVQVSDTQPASSALLIGGDGRTYPATGINVTQTPHTVYDPPPTIGLGIGGFGGNIGSSLGLGLPLGSPTPGRSSDQYVSTVTLPAPADYATNWQSYRVQVQVGNRTVTMAAPQPG
jgi:hypothetical protein